VRRESLAVHAGPEPDHTGAVSVPIYLASTFRQPGPAEPTGYEYSRTGNPTREAVEQAVAQLEGGARGLAFSSGMAAISTVLSLFRQGERVVVSENVYGGTFRVLTQVFARFGLEAVFVDTSDPAALAEALAPETAALFIETPTNPTMRITDLRRAAAFARIRGALVVVDNTFMTPHWQRPLELGADLVVHSATKYLGGHSDVVGGVVVCADEALGERLHFLQNSLGAVLPPFDSWLLLRGLKTLAVRMERHEANARRVVEWLTRHPHVTRVLYPGLARHPGHDIAASQASGFGGMVSFEVESDALADRLLRRVKLITLAESLGAVESLICLPSKMTHASIPPERRAELGITDRLVRLSVGIEHPDDLLDDLEQALA
jgi:cystathionine gamma-lyase/homocysteine desulfhydrase